jgi:16S rRNA processing protein RimM
VVNSKQHGADLLIKIAEYDTKESVSLLANYTIGILRTELPKLADGTYYWSELIGLTVINTKGEKLGTVQQLMATGAHDILVLIGERRRLIPYISQVIKKVALEEKTIYVDWKADYP